MALTDKQEMFCREYLIDLNATQAAIRAWYSEKTANRITAQLLSKVDIPNSIAQLKAQRNEQLNIDAADAADALQFVGDDPLKYQILVNQLRRVTSKSGLVARMTKAIKESEEALLLFAGESD